MTDDEWDFTIATDQTSVFKMTRAFANIMKKNNYGRIINIASMYGLVGNTEIPTIAYHSSKGGVVNFTRAAAAELAKYNITVNCICPGYFYTELTTAVLDTPRFQEFAKTHAVVSYDNRFLAACGEHFIHVELSILTRIVSESVI